MPYVGLADSKHHLVYNAGGKVKNTDFFPLEKNSM